MKIKELGIGSSSETEVTSICFDSKSVTEGALFFCLVGGRHDGHLFAQDAIERGAAAIVVERFIGCDIEQVNVDDTRAALSIAAQNFYGNPARRLKLIGVTGTNGKTTTTYILKSILEAAGKSVGVIGTNAVEYSGNKYGATLTTPDPIELNRIFKDMDDAGVEYVIMEASAHAIKLRKLDGLTFEVAAFTNFSRDHLDFFKDMNEYAETKKSFFTAKYARRAVVNADDEVGRSIIGNSRIPTFSYGCEQPCDVFGIDLDMSVMGLSYVINAFDEIGEVRFNLTGRFNMYNTLCAATVARVLDIPLKTVIKGIANLKKVDGRCNIINTSRCSIIIDFAHTDDGLANILRAVREFAPKRVITVFGCGGNRDRSKRPVMGKIAALMSDLCIITSDNPRYEPALEIINEIEAGIKEIGGKNYTIIVDRKQAVKYAIENAGEDDIVVIAGKGAERTQEIMGEKLPYNDEDYIMELAKEYDF